MSYISYDEGPTRDDHTECPHENWNSDHSGKRDEVRVWCDDCGETIETITEQELADKYGD